MLDWFYSTQSVELNGGAVNYSWRAVFEYPSTDMQAPGFKLCLSKACVYPERLVCGSVPKFVADGQPLTFRSALICVGKAYF